MDGFRVHQSACFAQVKQLAGASLRLYSSLGCEGRSWPQVFSQEVSRCAPKAVNTSCRFYPKDVDSVLPPYGLELRRLTVLELVPSMEPDVASWKAIFPFKGPSSGFHVDRRVPRFWLVLKGTNRNRTMLGVQLLDFSCCLCLDQFSGEQALWLLFFGHPLRKGDLDLALDHNVPDGWDLWNSTCLEETM